jgi:heterodisulfide reductase subunit C
MRNILQENKVDTSPCYQCYTCSLGCPMSSSMDLLPHQVVRFIQTGRDVEVINSNTIWQCINCETCVTRCPRGVDIPRLMDSLRHQYYKNQQKAKNKTAGFHILFIDGIRQNGIQFELALLIRLKLATLDLFSDLGLGIRMLLKGKLNFVPHRSKNIPELRSIFQKTVERI